jgi:AcrR family transcriptional regulator
VDESELSRGIQALWGVETKPRRGPKPSVTISEIASVAMEVADEDGLDAVTMAAVAGRLKLTTMALYRHVESRRDLLAVLGDVALGRPPQRSRRAGWRRQLTDWAWAEFRQFRIHPWALEIVFDGPPTGPHSTAWMDSGMQAIGRTGLDPQSAASALLVVDGFVRSMITQGRQYAGGAGPRWAETLAAVVTADEFQAVSRALSSGVFEDGEPFPSDHDVDFGLGLILDGIERLIAKR